MSGGGQTCYNCHTTLQFHGGSRGGWFSCIACHGSAGSEDMAPYRSSSADATFETIEFGEMLHSIHMGKELDNPEDFVVVGYGGSSHTYEEVEFPPMPGGVKNCAMCHGSSDSWMDPVNEDAEHSTEQGAPAAKWTGTCGSCHDSDAAWAHFNLQTYMGIESCTVCHAEGTDLSMETMHMLR